MKDDDHLLPRSDGRATPNEPSSTSPLSAEERLRKDTAELEITTIVKQVWLSGKRATLTNSDDFPNPHKIREQLLELRQAQEDDISTIAEAVLRLTVYPTLSGAEARARAEAMYSAMHSLSLRLGQAKRQANPGLDKEQ